MSNYVSAEDYAFYVTVQNISTFAFLIGCFGLNNVALNTQNAHFGAFLKAYFLIYINVSIISVIICIFYFYLNPQSSAVFLLTSLSCATLSFSICINITGLNYNLGKGSVKNGHLLFTALPKILILLLISIIYLLSEASFEQYLPLVLLLQLSLYLYFFFKEHAFQYKSKVYSGLRIYVYAWLTNLSYGAYMPILILVAGIQDILLVATLGLATLLSQPARMIYQFSIQSNIHKIRKEINISAQSTIVERSNIKSAYEKASKVGFYAILCFVILCVFTLDFINYHFFPNVPMLTKFTILLVGTHMVNAIFGPNGTLMALLNDTKIDFWSATLKLATLLAMAISKVEIFYIIIVSIIIEFIVNIVKNIFLSNKYNLHLFTSSVVLRSGLSLVVGSYIFYAV